MTHLTLAARSRPAASRSCRIASSAARPGSRLGRSVALLVADRPAAVWNSRLTWQTFGLSFITGTTWDPVAGIYGALPFIVGTILSSLIAIVLAAPIGILTAIFLAELRPGSPGRRR